eukprot:8722020-Pyramimonas_sp.AAC.1
MYKYKTGNKNSYPFLADMQGEFAFTLFDSEADSFLAGRDESGKYMLKQEFLLSLTLGQCLACRRYEAALHDPSFERPHLRPLVARLTQGVDKKTTGLLITSALLTSSYEMTEIPAGHFIFGKKRARLTHPMSMA